ncbi:ATP-binding protein [Actinomadura graeca]|uniref:histidine kinase n=1 Tax=Actinomadura graeca TaxID=2750812 RepID=A0ABX8QUJ6_9ACTN|nr:histidine kinase [Actinomadura graeca]QXJ22308.1 ATP-binding protein [Actinomadura graeca]
MPALPRSLWDEPRPPGAPARVWRDWALVGVLVPAAVLEGTLRPDVPWRTLSILLTVALVPTLLWRRTRPLLMVAIAFGLCGLAGLLTTGEPPTLNTMAFLLLPAYALFRWGSGREAAAGAAIILGKVAVSTAVDGTDPAAMFGAFAILCAAMAAGGAARYRARALQREMEQVKLLERQRLARDLHDTVAHHVTAIAIRAQAGLATAETHPGAATDALSVIEAEATRTLAEMRAIVRVLRRDQPSDPPAPPGLSAEPVSCGGSTPHTPRNGPVHGPRVTDLRRLASAAGSAPAVEVGISGDVDGLPPSVAAAACRLVQEAVTNARRHARHATRIDVRVTADDTAVRLRVSDDGEPCDGDDDGGPGDSRPAAAAGYGLVGMRERAGLLGGTCDAGPGPGRGWTVTAVLPRAGRET